MINSQYMKSFDLQEPSFLQIQSPIMDTDSNERIQVLKKLQKSRNEIMISNESSVCHTTYLKANRNDWLKKKPTMHNYDVDIQKYMPKVDKKQETLLLTPETTDAVQKMNEAQKSVSPMSGGNR